MERLQAVGAGYAEVLRVVANGSISETTCKGRKENKFLPQSVLRELPKRFGHETGSEIYAVFGSVGKEFRYLRDHGDGAELRTG